MSSHNRRSRRYAVIAHPHSFDPELDLDLDDLEVNDDVGSSPPPSPVRFPGWTQEEEAKQPQPQQQPGTVHMAGRPPSRLVQHGNAVMVDVLSTIANTGAALLAVAVPFAPPVMPMASPSSPSPIMLPQPQSTPTLTSSGHSASSTSNGCRSSSIGLQPVSGRIRVKPLSPTEGVDILFHRTTGGGVRDGVRATYTPSTIAALQVTPDTRPRVLSMPTLSPVGPSAPTAPTAPTAPYTASHAEALSSASKQLTTPRPPSHPRPPPQPQPQSQPQAPASRPVATSTFLQRMERTRARRRSADDVQDLLAESVSMNEVYGRPPELELDGGALLDQCDQRDGPALPSSILELLKQES